MGGCCTNAHLYTMMGGGLVQLWLSLKELHQELHQDGWRAGGPLVALHSMDHLGIHLLHAFHQNLANKHMTKTDIKTKTIKTI